MGEILSGGGDKELLAKGDRLRAHLDELVASGTEDTPGLDSFSLTMGRLLADRIGDHGVVPMGYVMATELLAYDCGATGVDGFTGQAMPRDVTGMPSVMYSLFRMQATQLARGAFGEEFAGQVEQVRGSIQDQQ